jgi:hypothetical protein
MTEVIKSEVELESELANDLATLKQLARELQESRELNARINKVSIFEVGE